MAYLSTIKDASTNEILAHNLSNNITLDIAIDTIHKLMNNTKFKLHKDAFIHSDQGAHYTSPRFQKLLKSKISDNLCPDAVIVGITPRRNLFWDI